MKHKEKIPMLVAMICMLILTNCSDQVEIVKPKTSDTKPNVSIASKSTGTSNARLPYALNWEGIDYMPTPPGVPVILVPWASGASRQFTIEIANDFRKANGWELLYNTFNTTTLEDRLYFILYNKYSGLIRMYFYVPANANYISSANIVHKLAIEGAYALNSPILNFADQIVIDVTKKSTFASMAEQWQVAPSTWYAFQYELAYDNQYSNQNSSTFSFIWPIRSTQISQVVLNGTVQGTLKGNIQMPGFDLTLSSVVSNTTGGTININGGSDGPKLSDLGQAFLTGAQGALEKAGSGIVEGILNGILGKNSSTNTDNVSLKLNAQIKLTGSIQQTFLLDSRSFAISGYNQAQTIGFSPEYNEPLGVFYISNKPTINEIIYVTPQTNASGQQIEPHRQYTYQTDPNSYQYIFNPSVLSRATISGIKTEVILYDSYGAYQIVGKRENIAGQFYYSGDMVGTDNNMGSILGVRISFDVVPNDGAPKITIAKTFVANKSTTEIITPPGEDQW
jgi:hypothetical protein